MAERPRVKGKAPRGWRSSSGYVWVKGENGSGEPVSPQEAMRRLPPGMKYEKPMNTPGKVYVAVPMTPAEIDAAVALLEERAAQQKKTDEVNRRQDAQSLQEQNAELRARTAREKEAAKEAARRGPSFRAGDQRGAEFMKQQSAHLKQKWSNLLSAKFGITSPVGDATIGQVGELDLGVDGESGGTPVTVNGDGEVTAVQVGNVQITSDGRAIATGNLGPVEVKVGVDVTGAVVQGAGEIVDGVANSPLGKLAERLGKTSAGGGG